LKKIRAIDKGYNWEIIPIKIQKWQLNRNAKSTIKNK
jgi:hypothetical protein